MTERSGRDLRGRRVMIMGASTGIGRATAIAAIRSGAHVALASRHTLRLDDAIAEAGEGSGSGVAIGCDVRDAQRVPAAVGEAVDALGGLDAVLYTAGINRLAFLADTDAEIWHDLLDTNLVGAALVARAALPALRASGGRIGFCSSDSVSHPFPALGAYAASKAALETMITAWRQEESEVTLARIVIGPTMTDMAAHWDPELSGAMFERWAAEGRFDGITPVTPEVVAHELVAWLATDPAPTEVDLYEKLAKA